MTVAPARPLHITIPRSDPGAASVWGLDAPDLHDRAWAGRGVEVVRPGAGFVRWERDALFLLIPRDTLACMEIPEPARRLTSTSPQVLCMQLRPPHGADDSVVEHVDTDASGRFVQARPKTTTSTHAGEVLFTRDPLVALAWRHAGDEDAARRAVRVAAGLAGWRCVEHAGRLLDAGDDDDRRECLRALLGGRHVTDPLTADVSQPRPGIHVHRSAAVDRRVRFVGPVWVGAGVQLGRGQVVLGPGVLEDVVPVPELGSAPTAPLPLPGPRRRRPALIAGTRLFDVVFSVLALLVTAPLLPLIILSIWLEDGRPFFFSHTRQTLGGRSFECYKFRTMHRFAEQLQGAFADRNLCDGPQVNLRDDPRILRCGRLLRRLHLDELPQFVNVLLGQMSVIGPRPSPERENRVCTAWRDARLSVRPGITGLWQVRRTRAPQVDFQEWIRYDLEYVRRRSWRLDAWILLQTVRVVLFGRGG
ncbi:MAG: sugar transferase [Planctomycetes bacterium]|nr:sugar transferase [Planctomycetota bacterium]